MSNSTTAVRIVDATRAYSVNNEQILALRGVNMTITRGSFTAFMGRSGSGKTTLLNMIGGLDTPTSGSIEFLGNDLSKLSPDELTLIRRNQIGFIAPGQQGQHRSEDFLAAHACSIGQALHHRGQVITAPLINRPLRPRAAA